MHNRKRSQHLKDGEFGFSTPIFPYEIGVCQHTFPGQCQMKQNADRRIRRTPFWQTKSNHWREDHVTCWITLYRGQGRTGIGHTSETAKGKS